MSNLSVQKSGIQGVTRKSTALDVIKIFWKGMKGYYWAFFLIVGAVVASSVLQVYVPILYKHFFDILTTATDKTAGAKLLVATIVSILVINLIIWFIYRATTIVQNVYQARVIAKLKQISFEYMMRHSYSFFANNFTGSLTQRVNRFARAFDTLSDRVIWSIVPLAVTITGIIIVLWHIEPIIAEIILAWVVVLFVINYLFSIWKVKYDIRMAELDSRTTGVLSDNITNQTTVQLFTGYEHEDKSYKAITDEQAHATTVSWNLSAIIDSVQSGFVVLSEFLLFFISIHYWQIGVFTIGTFVLIQAYLIGLGGRLWELSRIIRNLYEAFADAKEMSDILLTPHGVKDVPVALPLSVLQGKIEFKDLQFGFNPTRQVLDDISLTIEPAEKVAIIGPSGAGKSTLVRLILRMYDVGGGAISIDDQDIKHVTQQSLRSAIGFVPQEPILFHRSLKENIRYGRRDANDAEVFRAAELAHCDEFIKDLPLGYDTLVGERGIKLSGGERQRVAIARAILKNAPILILDEATSSLDSESEHLIQDALDTLMRGKTVIVIAHRLSTIRKMDRIVVVDQGKITEKGSHEELLQNNSSLYKKLWNLQAGGFISDTEEEPNSE